MEKKSADYINGQLDVYDRLAKVINTSAEIQLNYKQGFELVRKELQEIYKEIGKDIEEFNK